jgi:O-antigen ligase
MQFPDKLLRAFYYLLFFFTPLIVYTKTSELFEFNKLVFVYSITSLVLAAWIIKSVFNGKIIFKHTALTWPLLIFLLTQMISTLVSIDVRTSVFGYYSRFHGGLLSTISYIILYFAFVSNMGRKETLNTIYFALSSALLVSIYGILQHFGIDKHIWVQDVQNRVFSTLGQPNWLAAYLTALIPLIWSLILVKSISDKQKTKPILVFLYSFLSLVFFVTLLYTKSRSGILGFLVSFIVFWSLIAYTQLKSKITIGKSGLVFIPTISCLILAIFFIGTPWSPNISQFFKNQSGISLSETQQSPSGTPVLELGGTPSTEIRKIVWTGAIDIWKNYPVFGTGVETFAFAYYRFRPAAHNLTSEWDHLYNKAHNEYLNFAATSGIVGLSAYLFLIVFSVLQMLDLLLEKPKTEKLGNTLSLSEKNNYLKIGLLSGYVSILVTNFFGFSVVAVAIQFFLFPALAHSLTEAPLDKEKSKDIPETIYHQKILILFVLVITGFLTRAIFRYYLADLNYSKGKNNTDKGNYYDAKAQLEKAISYSPSEPLYWIELSEVSKNVALILYKENQPVAYDFVKKSEKEAQTASYLSPANVNIKRAQAANMVDLSAIEEGYLGKAIGILESAVFQAPTDAKLFYNLGYAELHAKKYSEAETTFEKAVALKSNYRLARLALAYIYIDKGESEKAKDQFLYILKNIDPNDEVSKQELRNLQIDSL